MNEFTYGYSSGQQGSFKYLGMPIQHPPINPLKPLSCLLYRKLGGYTNLG